MAKTFSVSVDRNSRLLVDVYTPKTYITLQDKVEVVPRDGEKIDSLEVFFFTPGSGGGFFPEPDRKTYADIPEEYYLGKTIFVFNPIDFFNERDIHGELVIKITKSRHTGYSMNPHVRPILPKEVTANVEYMEQKRRDASITITVEEGFVIRSLTLHEVLGDTYAPWNNYPDPEINEFTIPESVGKQEFTFAVRDHFALKGDVIYVDLIVEIMPDKEQDPIIVPLETMVRNAYVQPLLEEVNNQEDNVVTITTNHLHYFTEITIIKEYPTGAEYVKIDLYSDRLDTYELDLNEYIDEDLLGLVLKVEADKLSTNLLYDYEKDPNKQDIFTIIGATVFPDTKTRVNDDTTVVITAHEGLMFDHPMTLTFRIPKELIGNPFKDSEERYTIYPDEPEHEKYYNEDKSVMRIPLADFWVDEYYEYPPNLIRLDNVRATERKLTDGFVTNYATTYKMDRKSLDSFSDAVINMTDLSFMTGIYSRVHSIFMIPFELPKELISTEPKRITNFGKHTSNVIDAEAHYTLDNKYILPLGEIEVPETYGNVYDFKDTEVYLHAPYVEQPIKLDPTYTVGETVSLNMAIDLYNGNSTLNIHSSKIEGELVQRVNIPIKHEIPLISDPSNIIEGRIGGFIYNKITTPFIEVVRNKPYENYSMFGKPMNEHGIIGDYTGYVELDDTNVKTEATTSEQEMIERLLKSGVFIRNSTPSNVN